MSDTLNDPRIAEGMRAQMELRKKRLAEGAKQIGWKVGFGASAAKERFKLTAPVVGFLLDRALLASGASVSLAGWQKPAAEAEIAAYIGTDVPADANRDQARAAVAAIGPAIELADIDGAPDDLRGALAGDIYQRHVILGPRDASRSGFRLNGLKARVIKSGADVPVPADLQTNTGDFIDIVRHVADVMAALGDGLRAGQFIICGSLTAPMFLERTEKDIEFALEPIGAVSVKFQ
jgi:2-oxo-hept-3-ene-1,7-dioate hydratase